ncbi:MAG: hypothetical protein ACJ8F2_07025 [Xanthobacteraceae bacterium]
MNSSPPSAEPSPSPPNVGVTVLLLIIAVVLLLPGLCTVLFAGQMIATEDVVRLATRDPYFQLLLALWVICLLVSLGGVFLLRYALRRARIREVRS